MVSSGVLLRGHLSSILFLIFINDYISFILLRHCTNLLLADDLKLFMVKRQNTSIIQCDLNRISI